jgi:hypothetical protein
VNESTDLPCGVCDEVELLRGVLAESVRAMESLSARLTALVEWQRYAVGAERPVSFEEWLKEQSR